MIRKCIVILALLGGLFAFPATAQAKVSVFACEPEWASLAEAVGGNMVTAYAATSARQDPHHIRAKPSLIAKMRKADLVICSGAGLEVGWLPLLLQKAGHPQVQPGGDGFIMAADYVRMLEKPEKVDRSMGDIHPEGNPHVHLNPHNVRAVAEVLSGRLQKIDSANAALYRAQYETFVTQWTQATKKWEIMGRALKGKKVVTHHRSWSYLINWLGLELVNTLEPKPGLPANTGHLESLLKQVKAVPVAAIIRTPYASDEASIWLSGKSGIPAVELPYTVGAQGVTDLFMLYEVTLKSLSEVIHAQP